MKPRLIVSRFRSFRAGIALDQQLVPLLRAREALALDGQGLGVPVGDVELGLLQGDHVDDLVLEHPRPVERLVGGSRAGQRHDLAGAGPDGRDERQADRPAAEPLVVLHDLDLGRLGRGVAEPLGQLAVDRLEVPRHVLAQQLVLLRVDQGP